MPFAVWVFAVNVFHDASHFSLSMNWMVNKIGTDVGFMFNTPYVWYHQHVIGHHSFPNIKGKDPDLYHAPRFIRHSDDIKHKAQHYYQTLTFVITWMIGVPFGLLTHGISQALNREKYNRVVHFAKNKYLNTDTLRSRQAIYLFIVHVIPFLLHGFTLKALLFSIIPIYLFSVFFMISTQINHLTPHTHDQFDKNFFKHQILTSNNVASNNYLVFLFTGGLNLQTEHHLFPSVNHVHLRKLQPYVREICKKHGVPYNDTPSLWEALCQHVAHLR
jgi:fatty acid desaturase